jgi:hypothetical protein
MNRKPHQFKEFPKPITLIVYTKTPSKWLLVDRETGATYEGNPRGNWDKIEPKK